MINSIGLPNRGLAGYLEHDLPQLATLPVPLITNVMGSNADEVGQLLEALDGREEVAALELNVSCPNVKTGLDIGSDPAELTKLLAAVRGKTSKPLIVKLTPNTANVALVAAAAEASGADAVSLINTLRAFAAPFPHARFMPTGGVADEDLDVWLAQPNVVAVGGSWLAPKQDIEARDWEGIARRAAAAVARHKALRE